MLSLLPARGAKRAPARAVAIEVLDAAVPAHLADVVCVPPRVAALATIAKQREFAIEDLTSTWRALVTADHDVGRAYPRKGR